jgi:hypothetical protein
MVVMVDLVVAAAVAVVAAAAINIKQKTVRLVLTVFILL